MKKKAKGIVHIEENEDGTFHVRAYNIHEDDDEPDDRGEDS